MQKIVETPIKDIHPYPDNPRQNKEAVDKVAESIKEFGFKQPIVVDKEGTIIVGHTRLLAAKKLKMDTVPVLTADDLTEEQAKAYRLADNKTNEFAEWDFDLLASELQGIADIDMSEFGFDLSILDNPEEIEVEDDDFEPEPPEDPVSQKGDLYILGNHRLLCGDSCNMDDVTRLMGEDRADMVFTDPPWNVNYGAQQNHPSWKARTIENDHMETEEFKQFMYDIFASMNSVSKPGAMTYVVMSAQEWGNMMLALKDNDYHWSSTIIWHKDTLVLSRKDYHTQYEPIWYGWKEGESRLHPLEDRKQSDVWDIDRPKRSDEHPTMKPIPLVARAIQNSSNENDVVLDLFGGSGTTMMAAEQTRRKSRLMELDPKYVDVIVNRYVRNFGAENVTLIRDEQEIPYAEIEKENA